MTRVVSEVISWSKALLFAITLSIILSVFVIQPFSVMGSSMEPTLDGKDPNEANESGDRVMVLKTSYAFGEEPKYNDIVIIDSRISEKRTIEDSLLESPIVRKVLNSNYNETNYWIKRVIGEPGDLLEYIDGKVHRNGKALEEDYIKEGMLFPFDTIVVPKNHVFVMGDNRNGSHDSRNIGPIPTENVLGKVLFKY
ncbi:signal peptidase I [Salipaludibacillus sp. LMS25]|uniref:signal peptidase I n=1 Tax=Salipaludibacillus sp. LMS25 TaxID=2924031 RepID=UPI0020D1A6F2|nr:signal peptidase I [Salipaludibacillus sp. LMS25]UTR13775.1 signal peptidase I [Salipaludibacillus sp. LMS25]